MNYEGSKNIMGMKLHCGGTSTSTCSNTISSSSIIIWRNKNTTNNKPAILALVLGLAGASLSPSAVLGFHDRTTSTSSRCLCNGVPNISSTKRLVRTATGIRNNRCCTISSSTRLSMVLTTPESIIEEAVMANQSLLDDLIDECVLLTARRPIILQFRPNPVWTWTQWRGTTFSETWTLVLQHMCWATLVTSFLLPTMTSATTPTLKSLQGFDELFTQLLSVTTFTLTFFLDQSYTLWRKCLDLSRQLQGRLNDISFMLAAHAARTTSTCDFSSTHHPHITSSKTSSSQYTKPARQTLHLIARYIRLLNILSYASFTLSHRPILTPRGMRRLVERHIITPREREILVSASKLPATQKHNMVLLWITRAVIEAREAGHIRGGSGFEEQFLEQIDCIRANYGAIGGELQARMPFGTWLT
jgi:hypothetical protein